MNRLQKYAQLYRKKCIREDEGDPLAFVLMSKELEKVGITVSLNGHGRVAFFEYGKQFGKIYPASELHIACPFCGFPSSKSNPYQWCSGCYIEYYQDEEGDFIFDPLLHREEYRWAIALAKSGGARIGSR